MTKSDEWLQIYTLADYMLDGLYRSEQGRALICKRHQAHQYIDVMNNALGMYFSCLFQEEQENA